MVEIKIRKTRPYFNQKPGTSGLRQKTQVWTQTSYVENFIQSLFDALPNDYEGKTLVIGGDGRYYSDVVIQKVIKVCAGNRIGEVIVGQNGIFSTPALSHMIIKNNLYGGVILTASHNPGGIDGDFGIKFNPATGGPAPSSLTDEIFRISQEIRQFNEGTFDDIDLSIPTVYDFEGFKVTIVDPVKDYVELMQELFDFDTMRNTISKGLSVYFDAMHGVTGPYAVRIFHQLLGVPMNQLLRTRPLPDFGGCHPDPNLEYAAELVRRMNAVDAPHIGFASDGDGDRNLVHGARCFVSPGDSAAVIVEHRDSIPYFRDVFYGVARSMPTSHAVDLVAIGCGLPVYDVPTGWKYFVNLMEDKRISMCAEESFGTSSSHIREKDGIWATLCWLSVISKFLGDEDPKDHPEIVREILEAMFSKYGRCLFTRYDYENVPSEKAKIFFDKLDNYIENPETFVIEGFEVKTIENWSFTDPVDGSVADKQGWLFTFVDGSRFVFRQSGTGSSGATIRLYVENFVPKEVIQSGDVPSLDTFIKAILEATDLHVDIERNGPTVIT
eukprot:TRINITY_DN3130_c0_g2_i1.p1 TRINITY_DN3130_c0_g2~~TRINITY_DN3130_c0_g2_i1.p1  ORF type:complete len:564 (+),score=170.85 TRINITY_DN3130_c0_g2_i1:32-1693(+)